MRKYLIVLFVFLSTSAMLAAQDSTRLILIRTTYGNIKIRLYNETPLHRDNFIKLIEKGFFDSLLFHRVITKFMIQGGDPDSRKARPREKLGEGGPGYTVPAEFRPALFHKRGVLAAARDGDEENPEQASSGCQFYITQGKVFTDSLLNLAEKRITRMKAYNKVVRNPANVELFRQYSLYQKKEIPDSMKAVKARIDLLTDAEVAKMEPYRIPEDQRIIYKTEGGTPHLDGSYTVFGEVIEGMDVVDRIASAPRDENDRPKEDVRMYIRIVR